MYSKIFKHEMDENIAIEIYENEVLKLFRGRIVEISSELRLFVLFECTANDELNLLFTLASQYYADERERSKKT